MNIKPNNRGQTFYKLVGEIFNSCYISKFETSNSQVQLHDIINYLVVASKIDTRMTMATSKVNSKKTEGLLIALEKRIKEASNKVNMEMKKDHQMIDSLTKTEEKYLHKFQDLKKPCLAMAEHNNMKRMVDATENHDSLKDTSAISSDSTLLPRELFPQRTESNSSSNESSCDSKNHKKFVRKVTDLREEKLRKIMGNIKESMKRRESF